MVTEDRYEYEAIKIDTERGQVHFRYYSSSSSSEHPASVAVVYVTGVGGDWGTPAVQLYPRLCGSLSRMGIDGLRVRYRNPINLFESVFDTLTGIAFLLPIRRRGGGRRQGFEPCHVIILRACLLFTLISFSLFSPSIQLTREKHRVAKEHK